MTIHLLFNYFIVIIIMMSGLYIVIASTNLVKKIIGLNIFQASVFILYISMGKIFGATAPIIVDATNPFHANLTPLQYSNPLPHVLILTAIVVGVATTALGLALVVRIRRAYGTIEDSDLVKIEQDKY